MVGVLGFRFALNDLGNFVSNDENIEITYDGSLLSKFNILQEDISLTINFDVIIKTSEDVSYKGTVSLDMPVEGIIEQGTSKKEITEFSDVVFKRVK